MTTAFGRASEAGLWRSEVVETPRWFAPRRSRMLQAYQKGLITLAHPGIDIRTSNIWEHLKTSSPNDQATNWSRAQSISVTSICSKILQLLRNHSSLVSVQAEIDVRIIRLNIVIAMWAYCWPFKFPDPLRLINYPKILQDLGGLLGLLGGQ